MQDDLRTTTSLCTDFGSNNSIVHRQTTCASAAEGRQCVNIGKVLIYSVIVVPPTHTSSVADRTTDDGVVRQLYVKDTHTDTFLMIRNLLLGPGCDEDY